MRQTNLLSCAFAAITISFFCLSCSKSNSSKKTSDTNQGGITANVAGTPFVSSGTTLEAVDSNSNFYVTANATIGGYNATIQLVFPDYLPLQTPIYNHRPDPLKPDLLYTISYSNGVGSSYISAPLNPLDTIVITKLDKENHLIYGTFSGTLASGAGLSSPYMQLTQGEFNAYYTEKN